MYDLKTTVQAVATAKTTYGDTQGTDLSGEWTSAQRDTIALEGDWEPFQSDPFDSIVDPIWKRFSNDPTARALRELSIHNPVWRVLHRVTYVERAPPPLATRLVYTSATPIAEPANLAGNTELLTLITGLIHTANPTSAQVGAAVATVLNPAPLAPGDYPASLLEKTVPCRGSVEGGKPDTASVLADHLFGLSWFPDRDVQMAAGVLDGGRAGQVGVVEVVESLIPKIEAGVGEQGLGEALMQRLVLHVARHTPELGVAVCHLGVDGGGVQAEPRVAVQVAKLHGAWHAYEPEPALEDPRLHRADPRVAVRTQRRQHA